MQKLLAKKPDPSDLDTLGCSVHNTVLSLQVSMAEAIVMHEDDGIKKLLEVVSHCWLWQLFVLRNVEQVEQIWSLHKLPLQEHEAACRAGQGGQGRAGSGRTNSQKPIYSKQCKT